MADPKHRSAPGLVLLTTGGTIAGRTGSAGVTPQVTGAELGATLAQHLKIPVATEELFRMPSAALGVDDMLTIVRRVQQALQNDRGVIVTHGTDTVAETAWLTHLVVGDRPQRVAFATAMRNGDEIGSDGLRNLIDCARVITEPDPSGVVLVANGEIHAGCWVTKRSTAALQAFSSGERSPIGDLHTSTVTTWRPTPVAPRLPGEPRAMAPVAVVPTWDEHAEVTIPALLASGVAGLVLEGSGAGNLHPGCAAGVDLALARQVPVVVVSRAQGPTHRGYGGVAGSGRWIAERPILDGGTLGAARARIALSLGVGCLPTDELGDWFAQVVAAHRGQR